MSPEPIVFAYAADVQLTYAAGPATNPHIASELLNHLGKINLFAVHYKGG